jgi:hypothetical protein
MNCIGKDIWQLDIDSSTSIVYNRNFGEIRLLVNKEVKDTISVSDDYTLEKFERYVELVRKSAGQLITI